MKKDIYKYLHWSIYMYIGFILLALVTGIWAIITTQIWPLGAIVAIIGGNVMLLVFSIYGIWEKFKALPSYITKQGMAVWTVSGNPIRRELEYALEYYIKNFYQLISARTDYKITKKILRDMIFESELKFSKKPIDIISMQGWHVKNNAGLQAGKVIMLMIFPDISNTALFHELTHMWRQIVKNLPRDYNHLDSIWSIVREIEVEYRKISSIYHI